MPDDYLAGYRRLDLDRLNLAAGVILADPYTLTPALAAEIITFKKRVERALLLPDPDDDVAYAQVYAQATLRFTGRVPAARSAA